MTVSSTQSLPKKDVELTSRPPAAAPLPGGATATLRRTARRETRRSSRRDTGTRVVKRNRRLCNVSPGVSIPAASGAAPRQSVSRAATAQSLASPKPPPPPPPLPPPPSPPSPPAPPGEPPRPPLPADRHESLFTSSVSDAPCSYLEHLECSHQPHIQGRGAKKRTQRAG